MSDYLVTPAYKVLFQKKSLCGPACLQMVLFRRGEGELVDQEQLAYDAGLRIATGDEDKYSLPFASLPTDDGRMGMILPDFDGEQVQTLLARYNLKSKAHPINSIDDVESFLTTNIQKDNELLANFWVDNGREHGHFVLVSGYNDNGKIVGIVDPLFDVQNHYGMPLDKLVEGMSSKWTGRERGFVVISPR